MKADNFQFHFCCSRASFTIFLFALSRSGSVAEREKERKYFRLPRKFFSSSGFRLIPTISIVHAAGREPASADCQGEKRNFSVIFFATCQLPLDVFVFFSCTKIFRRKREKSKVTRASRDRRTLVTQKY